MAASGGTAKRLPSLPPPRPKSPPEYPDLYGKRRELAKVQMLEREIRFLEESEDPQIVSLLEMAMYLSAQVAHGLNVNVVASSHAADVVASFNVLPAPIALAANRHVVTPNVPRYPDVPVVQKTVATVAVYDWYHYSKVYPKKQEPLHTLTHKLRVAPHLKPSPKLKRFAYFSLSGPLSQHVSIKDERQKDTETIV
ncbi:hypothetical protein RJ640_009145 [Escallonia rubra]|uniref:Uncharacterized protein n=1 Tax=Escallonia rubra TaxID=112253 RepID=A0AA88R5H5_9ASTE|nr:hypothetical protein RJ640_009145 [Escallonia rubra]